jgi:hemerythrin superfamily protein
MDVAAADDLVSLLTRDHAAIQYHLAEFDSATPTSRAELFWKLTDMLVRHEVAEEVVVYPVVKEYPDGQAPAEARLAEEAETEKLLAAMEHLDPTTEPFMEALSELRQAVLDHAQAEETEVFPLLLAQEDSDSLLYHGQKFKGAKLAAPNRPHPHLPSGSKSQKVLGPIAAFFDHIRDGARASSSA